MYFSFVAHCIILTHLTPPLTYPPNTYAPITHMPPNTSATTSPPPPPPVLGYDGRETEQGFSVGVHMDSALRPFNQRIELTLDDDEGTIVHNISNQPTLPFFVINP